MKSPLLFAFIWLSGLPGWSQAPTITSISPRRNALAVSLSAPVQATFSQQVGAGSGAVRVFSALHGGRLNGATATSGNTLTFTPAQNFQPGEVVSVTVPTAVQNSAGVPLAAPQAFQFTAAAMGGTGTFRTSGGSIPTSTYLPRTTVGDVDGDGDLDLLTAEDTYNPGLVEVRFNNGSGLYVAGGSVAVGNFPSAVNLADVDGDGDLDLLASCNGVSVRLNNGQGIFSGGATVVMSADKLVAADLDGDGDLDLVGNNNGYVDIAFNNGTGTFLLGPQIITGNRTTVLAVGDLDGDGDFDLLTQGAAYTVGIHLNNGNGTFRATVVSVAVNLLGDLREVAVADVDGDGDLDILASDGISKVRVCLNDGSANFMGTNTLVTLGASASDVSLADVDGDGDLDLVAANTSAGTVSVRFNNGAGVFAGGTDLPIAYRILGVKVADVDGDFDLDLLVTVGGSVGVRVLLNENSSSPAPPLVITALAPTRNRLHVPRSSNVAVTFNQPPNNTLATLAALRVSSSQRGGRLAGQATLAGSTLTFDPAASFLPGEQVSVSVTRAARSSSTGPIVPQVYQFTAAVGGGTGNFGGGGQLNTVGYTIYPADMDGDGDLDLVTPNLGTFAINQNNGNGTFTPIAGNVIGQIPPGELVPADLDGDGDLDLVSANGGGSGISTICAGLNKGNGTFAPYTSVPVGRFAAGLAVGDVNGDGYPDAITVDDSQFAVVLNAGNGTFGRPNAFAVGFSPSRLALADIDNDGDLDLLMSSAQQIKISTNDGEGIFAAPTVVAVNSPGRLVAADVDGDGDLDLLTTNGQVVDVRFNNGNGSFGGGSSLTIAGTSTGTTFGIIGLAVGDVDGDGDLDLLAAGASSTGTVSLRLNNGNGVFSGGYDIPLGTNVIWPGTVALADLDGDGDLDLLASQWYAGFEFRFNQGTPTATQPAVAGPELELYPNPAHESITVRVQLNTASAISHQLPFPIELLNSLGQVVARSTLEFTGQTAMATIPVEHLAAGLYLVRLHTNSGSLTRQIAVY